MMSDGLAQTCRHTETKTGEICDGMEEQHYKYRSLPVVGIECRGTSVLE